MRHRRELLCALIFWALISTAPGAGLSALDFETREKIQRSVVYIEAEIALSTADWNSLPDEIAERIGRRPRGVVSGTGFFVAPEGFIITNSHVVDGFTEAVYPDGRVRRLPGAASGGGRFDPNDRNQPYRLRYTPTSFKVVIRSGERDELVLQPKILKIDRRVDLALLRVPAVEAFDYFEVDPRSRVQTGQPVLMAGFPGGNLPAIAPFVNSSNFESLRNVHPRVSMNTGMVTSVREFRGSRRYQLDIRANHGNSGGPITDGEGRVIGILYAGLDTMQSINFAIPVAYLKNVFTPALSDFVWGDWEENKDSLGQTYGEFLRSGKFSFGAAEPLSSTRSSTKRSRP